MRAKRKTVAAGAMLVLLCAASAASAADAAAEQLIVFVQPGASPVNDAFEKEVLPKIETMAAEMGVELRVIDATEGVPEAVAITPLIAFQNHRGRSVYQGRTTTLDRLRNFVRTARYVAQGDEPLVREDILAWTKERMTIAAPVKVTELSGTRSAGYDHDAFVTEARAAMEKGLKMFRRQERVELGRADRLFYFDFYPYRAEDGTLYVSTALYSQFHCKIPVYEKKEDPFTGPWETRGDVFAKAAAAMEKALLRVTSDPAGGDGFDRVAKAVPVKTWDELGLSLPPAPKGRAVDKPADIDLPRSWVLDPPSPDDPPVVQFRFPPPLDAYVGEAKDVTATLVLSRDRSVQGASGQVVVDPASVTMGLEDLDKVIRGPTFLNATEFPKAVLVIDSIDSRAGELPFGVLTPATAKGSISMKGVSVPLTAVAEFEPVVAEDGTPRLIASGTFRVDLRDFKIPGADGPAPERYTVVFDGRLRLKPAGD